VVYDCGCPEAFGGGLLAQFATMNTTIQHMVDDTMRGRVLSIYALMFMGLFPLGNFEVGLLSQHFSPGFAIRVGAIIIVGVSLFIFFLRKRIRTQYHAYKT